jgi:hypothetical protein
MRRHAEIPLFKVNNIPVRIVRWKGEDVFHEWAIQFAGSGRYYHTLEAVIAYLNGRWWKKRMDGVMGADFVSDLQEEKVLATFEEIENDMTKWNYD